MRPVFSFATLAELLIAFNSLEFANIAVALRPLDHTGVLALEGIRAQLLAVGESCVTPFPVLDPTDNADEGADPHRVAVLWGGAPITARRPVREFDGGFAEGAASVSRCLVRSKPSAGTAAVRAPVRHTCLLAVRWPASHTSSYSLRGVSRPPTSTAPRPATPSLPLSSPNFTSPPSLELHDPIESQGNRIWISISTTSIDNAPCFQHRLISLGSDVAAVRS